MNVAEIHPISELSRHARALIQRVRERQEPIVITQRGHEAAVLVPVELYREMDRKTTVRVPSFRLARAEDAARFQVKTTIIDEPTE